MLLDESSIEKPKTNRSNRAVHKLMQDTNHSVIVDLDSASVDDDHSSPKARADIYALRVHAERKHHNNAPKTSVTPPSCNLSLRNQPLATRCHEATINKIQQSVTSAVDIRHELPSQQTDKVCVSSGRQPLFEAVCISMYEAKHHTNHEKISVDLDASSLGRPVRGISYKDASAPGSVFPCKTSALPTKTIDTQTHEVTNSIITNRGHVHEMSRQMTGTEYGVRLRDMQLIVVGHGPAIEKIVQRRLANGGRICILWTDTFPTKVGPAIGTTASFGAAVREDPPIGTWEPAFVWQPPKAFQRDSSDMRFKSLCDKHCGSAGWLRHPYKMGPDLVSLSPDQDYEVLASKDGLATGVRIHQRICNSVVWQLSGAVETVGLMDVEHCGALDVFVHCEEAKTFAVVPVRHFISVAAYYFIYLLILHISLCLAASNHDYVAFSWVRLTFPAGLLVFGAGQAPEWFVALTGQGASPLIKVVCAVVCVMCVSLASTMKFSIRGSTFAWPLFVVCAIGVAAYILILTPIHIFCVRFTVKSKLQETGKRFAFSAHFLWCIVLMSGTLGTWVLLYAVAIAYIALGKSMPSLASIFLPCATTLVELGLTTLVSVAYEQLVFSARVNTASEIEVLGDQRSVVFLPIACTHAFAEGTRLGTIMCSTILADDFSWILGIASCFVVNLVARTGLARYVWLKLQRKLGSCGKPSIGSLLHDEAKFLFGYARFIGVIAIGLARLVVFGDLTRALMSWHAVSVVVVCVVLEVVEDTIVGTEIRFHRAWRKHHADYYKSYQAFHPKQVFAKDRRDVIWNEPSISLHGVRETSLEQTFAVMAPATLFTPFLLTVLLGAGYWFGCCSEPIAQDKQLLEAVLWEVPLAC